jgi:hypothetical protein
MKTAFIKNCFLFTVGNICRVRRSCLGDKRFADDEELETEVRKWLRQRQEISMLRVSTHYKCDGTSLSMLVEDISRNKCFFHIQISHVLRFISICDLFTDSASHYYVPDCRPELKSHEF